MRSPNQLMSERGDAECSLAVLHVRRGKCLQKKEAHRARLTGLCVVAIRYIEGVPPTCDAWPSCQGRCIVCLNIPREVKNHHNKLVIKKCACPNKLYDKGYPRVFK